MATWLQEERFGDGSDGDYAPSTGTDAPIDSSCSGTAATTSLTATNVNFAANQIILIHQSRGTGVGQWELNVIQSYTAGTITTKYNLAYTYTDSGASQAQVLVFKQYSSVLIDTGVTLTGKGWNGDVGGIPGWMCNGTTTITGSINGNALGFRNYGTQGGENNGGIQGEGTVGTGGMTNVANGNGGGGGEHSPGGGSCTGGGGGGHGVVGSNSGDTGEITEGIGGEAAGAANLSTIVFGGQGGGGGRHTGTAGEGGYGGAIIAIFTEDIAITGTITSNANNGSTATGNDAGGGGGGAGGSVLIKCDTATLGTNLITVAAGTHGEGYAGGQPGGDGAVGRIHLSYLTSYTGTTTPTLDVSQDTEMSSTSTSTSTTQSTSTSLSTSTSSTTTSQSTSTSTTRSTSTSSTTTSQSTSTSTTQSTSTSSTTTSSSLSTTTTTSTTILPIGGLDFIRKRFEYRIFDDDIFKASWTDEVINEPRFRNSINSGPGELIIRLSRAFDDFGEDDDVKLNNRVDLWVYDRQVPNGKLIYRGFISGYRPILDGNKEYVEVTALNYVFELSHYMLEDASGNTKVAYLSYDPSAILRDVIVKYRANGGTLNYTPTSIQNTNTTVTYTFNTNTVREAIDKCVELAPEGWYWTVGTDSIIYFKPKEAVSAHKFQIGRHISKMETWRRIEDVVNKVYFTGNTTVSGTGLYRKYSNTGSIASYGMHAVNMTDGRVSITGTADIMANRMINNKKDPEIRTALTLLDNNGTYQYKGYDIESVLPGETIQILNIKQGVKTTSLWGIMIWGTDVWGATLAYTAADVIQIMSIDYTPDALAIEATSRLPDISKRIEDIDRNLTSLQVKDNPTAPVAG